MQEFLKNDDELFRDDLSDIGNYALLTDYFKQFSFYADGYKIAADNLINSCIYDMPFGRGDIDVLVYPIVFNYRHYTELRLKEIILILRCFAGEANKGFKHHNLEKLWNELLKLYQDFREDIDKEDFENAERIIFQMHKMDEASFNFRYPTNTKGNKKSLEVEKINIRNFGEVMQKLAHFLDSLFDMVDNYNNI